MRSPRLAVAAAAAFAVLVAASAAGATLPRFTNVKLDGATYATEPRVTITPDRSRYVVTNDAQTGAEVVYRSTDGARTFGRTAADPTQGPAASIDVDIVSTHTGRIITTELDFAGISFYVSYSDDGGKTWTASSGASLADEDRPWLAVGPDDPVTKQPTVYLLWHNLFSGTGTHNMWVQKSVDGGASFGDPVPLTLPLTQAWQDLQCADSGGPSSITVNQQTGDVYAVWGARTAPDLGGCGASIFGPFEVNVVGATRIWVARLPSGEDNVTGNWQDVLAYDGAGHIVGMQLSPGTLDDEGNLYVAFTESPHQYPNYDGAALRYVWAPGSLHAFSDAVTVTPGGAVGNLLPHVIAGDPGKLDFSYYQGVPRSDKSPVWYETFAQTLNGLSEAPTFVHKRVSRVAAWTGTASQLMGACGSGPASGVENGLLCGRSTDVWGVALDRACRLTIAWPTNTTDAPTNDPGTFVSTQRGGDTLCG
jgi:hypothetical protein